MGSLSSTFNKRDERIVTCAVESVFSKHALALLERRFCSERTLGDTCAERGVSAEEKVGNIAREARRLRVKRLCIAQRASGPFADIGWDKLPACSATRGERESCTYRNRVCYQRCI